MAEEYMTAQVYNLEQEVVVAGEVLANEPDFVLVQSKNPITQEEGARVWVPKTQISKIVFQK